MLKRYTDYTTQELANVTEEELQRLIEIECMREGISVFAVKPKMMSLPVVPEPDMVVYEIDSFKFTDKKEAQKLLELLEDSQSLCKLDYEYGYGYDNKYVKPCKNEERMETLHVYSKQKYEEAKNAMKEKEEIQKKNNSLKEKYKKDIEPYEEIKKTVMDVYRNALYEEGRYADAKGVYQKYLSLSNGDTETADNFFKETSYDNYLERIKEELKDGTHTEL